MNLEIRIKDGPTFNVPVRTIGDAQTRAGWIGVNGYHDIKGGAFRYYPPHKIDIIICESHVDPLART